MIQKPASSGTTVSRAVAAAGASVIATFAAAPKIARRRPRSASGVNSMMRAVPAVVNAT